MSNMQLNEQKQSVAHSTEKLRHLQPRATPYLSMDLDVVTNHYQEFRRHLPEATVYYAAKCNPNLDVLGRLHSLGSSFEIASLPELELLVSIGANPQDVIFSNPVKPVAHIAGTHAAGLRRYAFDSECEIEKLTGSAPGAQVYARMATIPAGSTVPSEGKFGVPGDDCIRLLGLARDSGLKPYGLAFHVGSQMNNPASWESAIEESGRVMRKLLEQDIRLEYLDLGGGFPAHYGEDVPDIESFAKVIQAAIKQHLPYELALGIEPGRALVADAGVMVASVIGVARRGSANWVHLDVGAFNGMMEALETQNELRFPMSDSKMLAQDFNGSTTKWNVTGPTCDSQDTILYGVELAADLAVDDKVFIHTAGAYTTAYASEFNGFTIPKTYSE